MVVLRALMAMIISYVEGHISTPCHIW